MITALLISLAIVGEPAPAKQARRDASPIVLMPGFLGWAELPLFGAYFRDVKEALEKDGFVVFAVGPPPVASSEERARFLMRFVEDVKKKTGAGKVHIIAHSQGGVDARIMLANGGAESIATVVTLASPHRGTGLADRSSLLPRELVQLALGAVAVSWQWTQGLDVSTPDASGSLGSLSIDGVAKFNQATGALPAVPFFSVAGLAGNDVDGSCRGGAWSTPFRKDRLHPLFVLGHEMDQQALGRVSDDGVVPTASMRFGRFLGCAPADHVDWMGWNIGDHDEDGYVPFDHAAFIVELARGLHDVETQGSADAMNSHLPKLAKLAHAVYLGPPKEIPVGGGLTLK